MRKIFVGIILVICVIIFTINFLKTNRGNMNNIGKEKAIKIANKEAINLGYDIKIMDIKINRYDTPWNDYLPKDCKSEYCIERQNKLINKKYWTIYYYYKPKQSGESFKGGDLCIFIDAHNGEILTTYRGK